MKVSDIISFLESLAHPSLQEHYDNAGLKKINGRNYVEKAVITAIKNDVAIYAMHTNLDNVLEGVNGKIASLLGLSDNLILAQKDGMLKKLFTFAPVDHALQ